MRWLGRIAPGSCGAVFTGHAVLLSPALTALTRAMLSLLVRPLMVGTVIGGSLAEESPAFAVLDAVPAPPAALPVPGAEAEAGSDASVDELVAPLAVVEASATFVPSGGTSPFGEECASLLAAQAAAAIRVAERIANFD